MATAGAPLVNELLGLDIPVPGTPRSWATPHGVDAHDGLFGWLLAAMSTHSGSEVGAWPDLVSQNVAYAPSIDITDIMTDEVKRLAGLSDAQLVAHVHDSVDWSLAGPPDRGTEGSRSFIKIGHAYWEYLALRSLSRVHLEYVRPMALDSLSDASGFDEMLAALIDRHLLAPPEVRRDTLVLAQEEVDLAISFGSGDVTHDLDIELPLHPVIRGAMVGSLSYFKALSPEARKLRVGDGSLAKLLFWEDSLNSLIDSVRDWSDAIVFVVPTHLGGIRLQGWEGKVHTIVLPETRAYEFWPAVLAYCAGRFETIFRSASRVSVFLQCGVMTVPLSLLVSKMARTFPIAQTRFYDFGQVLDIACHPQVSGPWTGKEGVQAQINKMRRLPFGCSAPSAAAQSVDK